MVNEDAKDNIEQCKGTNEKEGDLYRYKERLRLYKRWPCSTYILNRVN